MEKQMRARRRVVGILTAIVATAAAIEGAQSPQSGTPDTRATTIARTGCIVDEATFVRLTGLAPNPAPGSPDPRLVLMIGTGAAARDSSYVLTGTRERELLAHAESHVELLGTVEQPAERPPAVRTVRPDAALPDGATGITPEGTAAHEPGDAARPLPAEGDVRPASHGRSTPDSPAGLADLPRLNVSAFNVADGACPTRPAPARTEPSANEASSRAAAPRPAASEAAAASGFPAGVVTVVGCVLRATAPVDDPAGADGESLVITRAAVVDPSAPANTRSAVPGSRPSGQGSGTVPTREIPTGTSGGGTGLTFALEGERPDLADFAGRSVSVQGTIRSDARAGAERPSAHSTAPVATLVVKSFSAIAGGVCR